MKTKEELIAFERKIADLWEAGKINAPIHLCGGNEDELVKLFNGIGPLDYIFCGHRNHYHALLKGITEDELLSEILGEPGAICRGTARSMGIIHAGHRFYASAIVGGLCSAAVGTAYGIRQRSGMESVYCFVGEGALDGGHFWESAIYAASNNLPIRFVVEDNGRATCTPTSERFPDDVRQRILSGLYPFITRYEYKPTWPHVGTGKYVQF